MHQPNAEPYFMSLAIEKARAGIASGQSPFGAIIVRDQAVVAVTHNTVWQDLDPTAHAEVNCIRRAAKATIFSSSQPCRQRWMFVVP